LSEEIKRGTLCSLDSLGADEEMYGTATAVETWLVLEYRERWSGDAFRDSRIPEAVKAGIKRYLETLPNSRLQLVKQENRSEDGIKLFIAHSREKDPFLREITLSGYEDLLDNDLGSVIKNLSTERSEPLFLMCTNGEHDKCCGKFGMPVYRDVAAGAHGRSAWQSTHIGGHRFASTLVCLPHGLYYGRVREGTRADEIFGEYMQGRIDLGSYRGRSCYSPPAQAAEYFLRKETGVRVINAYSFKGAGEENGEIRAEFISATDNRIYLVRLRKLEASLKVLKSCGDKERAFIPQYRLLGIEEV